MSRKKEVFMLVLFILIFLALNYGFLDTKVTEFLEESDTVFVQRVIDGDTIVTGEDIHVRLLGINTPERGERYYSEAKEFLEMVSLNKTVTLKYGKEKEDRYGRTLAYMFIDGKNVNKVLVDEGYANFYFPSGKDEYYSSFSDAWKHCLVNNKYLCEKSEDECARCVELIDLEMKGQTLVLYNNCSFSCNLKGWSIKDEGRKKFVFPSLVLEGKKEVSIIVGNKTNTDSILYWKGEEYVWTSTGDTFFLRDSQGKLVFWRSY